MTAYRAGQRVRIEWPNGSAVEGVVGTWNGHSMGVQLNRNSQYYVSVTPTVTVTVLSEPRPDEPTGLGAVVEAAVNDDSDEPRPWVLIPKSSSTQSGQEWHDGIGISDWSDLVDPVVLSEGWTS